MLLEKKLTNHFLNYTKNIQNFLKKLDLNILTKIVTEIIRTYKEDRNIFFVGNGGSAATASHFQADFQFFLGRNMKKRPKVMSLTDQLPLITAISNDISYADIFVEQMRGIFKKDDVLIAISASGNSVNVIKAVEFAHKCGGTSIGFVGFDGGKLKDLVHMCLIVKTAKGEYGIVEDIHLILGHMIVLFLVNNKEFIE